MSYQSFCKFHCAFAMLTHAKMKRLNSTDHQPAVERRKDGTAGILNEFYFFSQFPLLCDNNTGDKITMTAEIFCCRMNDDIGAEIKRFLQNGGSKRIINTEQTVC